MNRCAARTKASWNLTSKGRQRCVMASCNTPVQSHHHFQYECTSGELHRFQLIFFWRKLESRTHLQIVTKSCRTAAGKPSRSSRTMTTGGHCLTATDSPPEDLCFFLGEPDCNKSNRWSHFLPLPRCQTGERNQMQTKFFLNTEEEHKASTQILTLMHRKKLPKQNVIP